MSRGKKNLRALIFGVMVFTFACVTINIYFPAEKVESIAGEIVNDIRGQDKEKPVQKDKTSFWRGFPLLPRGEPGLGPGCHVGLQSDHSSSKGENEGKLPADETLLCKRGSG